MVVRVAAWTLAVVFVAGCGSSGDPATPTDAGSAGDAAAAAATVELGTGESAFVPIAMSGASLELVHGPQGGYHLSLTCRFSGLSPDNLLVRYDVFEAGRMTMWNMTAEYVLAPDRVTPDGAGFVRLGDRAVLDITSPPDIVGHTVTVRVCLLPPGGAAKVVDSRAIVVTDDIP